MSKAMDEVTATEAANLTGLSERTIRRKIASGEIRARRIASNRFAIRVRDLPVQRSTTALEARIDALERRVRQLEAQALQHDAPPEGIHDAMPSAEWDGAGSLSRDLEPDQLTELRDVLGEVLREVRRLAPQDIVSAQMPRNEPAASTPGPRK